METNGTPGESLGSLPAAWTEPGEIEGTSGRSSDSPQEAEEINLTSLEPIDPVDALGESFGSLSVGCADPESSKKAEYQSTSTCKHQNQRRTKTRQCGGKKKFNMVRETRSPHP